jgi:hypothetical protein
MSEKLNVLDVPPEFHAHARHYAAVFKRLGMTRDQIDKTIAYGAAFQGKREDLPSYFEQFAEQHGLDSEIVGLSLSWRDQVVERGIENMPQVEAAASSPDADAKRLHEIEEDMRKLKGESEYWKDPEVRDLYLELLERSDGKEYTPAPTGNDAGRRAEIETMMKTERARYFRDEGVQARVSANLATRNRRSAGHGTCERTNPNRRI